MVADDVQLGGTLGRYAVQTAQGPQRSPSSTTAPPTARAWPPSSRRPPRPGATIVRREFTNDKATDFTGILTGIKAPEAGCDLLRRHGRRGRPDAAADASSWASRPSSWAVTGSARVSCPSLPGGQLPDGQVVCAIAGGVDAAQRPVLGRVQGRLQEEVRRRCADLRPTPMTRSMCWLRQWQKAGSAEPAKYLPVLQKIIRIQRCDRHDRLRREGRHPQRRADALHLQG
jgi:branched-chain amino acid transport system substrate-binding protein